MQFFKNNTFRLIEVNITFTYKRTNEIIEGTLIYRKEDHSFDFEPMRSSDFTILIGYLNITFNSHTRAARQIWGLNSYDSWQHKTLQKPVSFKGDLLLDASIKIESGEAERIIEVDTWSTFYDKQSGWICIGHPEYHLAEIAIEFASSTIAILENHTLKAIWLKPHFVT